MTGLTSRASQRRFAVSSRADAIGPAWLRSVVRPSMRSRPASCGAAVHHAWRRFWLLLGAFFVAFVLAGLLPTPGAWSDTRSQWVAPGAIALTAVMFLFIVQWDYRRRRLLSRSQVWILSALFAAVLVLISFSLWESVTFLRSVPERGGQATAQAPNHSVEPTATRRRVEDLRMLSDSRSPVCLAALGGVAVAHFCR
jgi:hypothetical protein